MSQDCPICFQALTTDVCLVDCSAMHLFHHTCISGWISSFKSQCPLDRQSITNCLHEGKPKKLPNEPVFEQVMMEMMQEDNGCYICNLQTRNGLDVDELVICSDCDNVFCHAQCESSVTGQPFNYNYRWFCPACRQRRAARMRRVRA